MIPLSSTPRSWFCYHATFNPDNMILCHRYFIQRNVIRLLFTSCKFVSYSDNMYIHIIPIEHNTVVKRQDVNFGKYNTVYMMEWNISRTGGIPQSLHGLMSDIYQLNEFWIMHKLRIYHISREYNYYGVTLNREG